MQTDLEVPALWLRHKPLDFVISLPGSFLLGRIQDLADEVSVQSGIAWLPQQEAVGRVTIAPGAPRFLVILLDGFWQRHVDHRAHVGLSATQLPYERRTNASGGANNHMQGRAVHEGIEDVMRPVSCFAPIR